VRPKCRSIDTRAVDHDRKKTCVCFVHQYFARRRQSDDGQVPTDVTKRTKRKRCGSTRTTPSRTVSDVDVAFSVLSNSKNNKRKKKRLSISRVPYIYIYIYDDLIWIASVGKCSRCPGPDDFATPGHVETTRKRRFRTFQR